MKLSQLKQQIEELDAKATKGPLSVETVPTSVGICHKIGPLDKRPGATRENYACVYVDYPGSGPHEEKMEATAKLFALSRTALPELLRRLLVAEEVLENQIRVDGHNKGCSYDMMSFDRCCDRCTCGRTCDKALATIRGEEE